MGEIKIPELAESITEGTVAQWLKKTGEYVEKGDYIVELETDKVNVEIISEESGILQELKANEGDTVQVGEIIAIVSEGGANTKPAETPPKAAVQEAPVVTEAPPAKEEPSPIKPEAKGYPIASPSARKLAREKGIDLSQVPSNDPLGRLRAHDVIEHDRRKEQPAPSAPKEKENKQPQAAEAKPGKPTERVRMTRRRQTIASRLVEVQQNTAMLTTFNEVDMSNIMKLRNKRKDQFHKENDVKLGFMSFFTKAVVACLKKAPLLNAEIQGDEIVLKKFYDIGIAVSTDDGLVVPVLRDADRKNFAEIESDIMTFADKARNNKLSLSDLQGGTFTITNGGVFGSLLSTPILNGPQVGILGMHKIQMRPVAIDNEKMENRPMMYLALSYDHRIIDGKEAVTFLARVKALLEDPESLLFEA
ncbi:2-oxoglutarate dehydrogenase complex dihydrolipoyllysine-residue succinyltransferase [Niallia taxi]|uniref:2-oxoglutarate dehydrogenase complex dihydrolipoyllysine-residue succinyltransferase n=1 Tax=Niallia taxi TaxID=2499688 RepID=UPI0015F7821B|nr:2-oxoglutarate dehydrogenase complex dihydrolipoyllysine-residue succinyltransferase [Niallia taxi]MCM3214385.1 2-oxoglutarate dehydrogenase complex dihydrolipoyllysine-residue succinyltransferase [Niallia taxi]MDK8641163.1 2-oxoglutarate dehydrogenase complex dihydrolipoyllysine-residue succinyltransferase [Niallia taxi]MED4039895.1 2-oxoglutarate dehydrogenase complex dihydrolipoyllysine-residue succinyltransferase [Niallia taxi]MED4052577.1 2-oxoglutarate dehydrogenase complex dihydrolipo